MHINFNSIEVSEVNTKCYYSSTLKSNGDNFINKTQNWYGCLLTKEEQSDDDQLVTKRREKQMERRSLSYILRKNLYLSR